MLARVDIAVRHLALSVFLPLLLLSGSYGMSGDDNKKPNFPVDLLSIETTLVDENGKAIPNVKARVFGVRCLEDQGSWYSWPADNAGATEERTSDENGKIEFKYPVKFGVPEKWLTTTTLDVTFSHPDIVPHRQEFKISKVPEKVALTLGCKVDLRAVDVAGKPVEKFLPLISSHSGLPKWSFANGTCSSGELPEGKLSCMLVCPSDSGTLFSPLILLETSKAKKLSLPAIPMKPGKRIVGNLPSNVPRPIVDGTVSIEVLIESEEPLGGKEPISWDDTTAIAEDGSFEFTSVPGPGQVQVIAICRGWLIETVGGNAERIKGKTFDLKKDQKELTVEFEMEQTGNIQIELMNTDGESIAGAEVATWPNKLLLSGGSTVLTSNYRSIEMVDKLLSGKLKTFAWEKPAPNRHYQISDAEGMVTLRDIPAGATEQISVSHPDYELPYEPGSVRNEVTYTVKAGETEEKLLVLQKRSSKK